MLNIVHSLSQHADHVINIIITADSLNRGIV